MNSNSMSTIGEKATTRYRKVVPIAFLRGQEIVIAEVMGTVESGGLKLDTVLPFPDKTRVKLIVEPAWDASQAREAWQALLAKIYEHPIMGGGGPCSRKELYDRN
jgi:hypothetical protein